MGERSETPPYTVECRENGRRLSIEPIPDPFINTTIRPRGWRVALAVLRRRYSVTVVVGGDSATVERVLELDPDYIGPPGSKSREAWNAQLQGELRRFAEEHP